MDVGLKVDYMSLSGKTSLTKLKQRLLGRKGAQTSILNYEEMSEFEKKENGGK